ncbi:hypothetical protein EZS27_038051 [termite gut metagenome]|uniref:Uncharacterized protein n=1 Tax=termite gut metagenome TaxID=433724 RepID=A0A5J4PMH3_9ZZZZ
MRHKFITLNKLQRYKLIHSAFAKKQKDAKTNKITPHFPLLERSLYLESGYEK